MTNDLATDPVWRGRRTAFVRWCRDADDADALERALRSVPAFLWDDVRDDLRAAVDARGPLHPVVQRFAEIDAAMTAPLRL